MFGIEKSQVRTRSIDAIILLKLRAAEDNGGWVPPELIRYAPRRRGVVWGGVAWRGVA